MMIINFEVILATKQMATALVRELGKKVDSLKSMRQEIIQHLMC
jgi:hypothetical protein